MLTAHCATRHTGALDLFPVLFTPRRVLQRVEDVQRWGWPLLVLLAVVTGIGWATVQTGLIDQQVRQGVEFRKALIEKDMHDVVELAKLREMYQNLDKESIFWRRLAWVQAVVAPPGVLLASVLLLASLLYGVVALTGRKPEWHTLLTVCVLAASADAAAALLRLGLIVRFRTLAVDTSFAPLAMLWQTPGAESGRQLSVVAGLLGAVDPFRIWFWIIIGVGLSVTMQLRGWRTWALCVLCWLVAAAARTGWLFLPLPGASA